MLSGSACRTPMLVGGRVGWKHTWQTAAWKGRAEPRSLSWAGEVEEAG